MLDNVWKKLWGRTLIIGLFIFAVYSNVGLIIRNYHLHKQVDQSQAQVDQLKIRNQKLALLISYYQSPSYQNVEARRRLGLKQPGETAYVVKGVEFPTASPNDSLESVVYKESNNRIVESVGSNFAQWMDYFNGKK